MSLFVLSPSKMGGLKFLPIYEPLTIRAQKNAPPHIAFEEVYNSASSQDEWSAFVDQAATTLASGTDLKQALSPAVIYPQKLVLDEMVVSKKIEVVHSGHVMDEQSWRNELSQQLTPHQKEILEQAQGRTAVLEQDWSVPTWSEEVKKQLRNVGFAENAGRIQPPQEQTRENPIFIAAENEKGERKTVVPRSEVEVPAFVGTDKTIHGQIEISGGLAVTNEHYIEIRRMNEGIAKELGSVNLKNGTYNIGVQDFAGSIEGKLLNKEGHVLGEGSIRIARLDISKQTVAGPKLRIEPQSPFNGFVSNYYKGSSEGTAPAKTIATLFKGAEEFKTKKEGRISVAKIARGSTTVVRAAAPGFMQTASLVTAGEEFGTPLFPKSMIKALKEIITNEKAESSASEFETVIWGTATLDGKPVSGIEVFVESDPSVQAIYFNEFLLPDLQLKATSSNGIYAFINVSEGFHSLRAQRGESQFGYQNAVIENGSVALANLEHTIRTESIPLRVFDAFTGAPQDAAIEMQSLENELSTSGGAAVLTLPQISRMGMARVQPAGNSYLAGRYFYNDKDNFLHFPLVSWSWLSAIKTFLKLDDQVSSAIIVGFVPEENFEVYLAGYDNYEKRNIVYFDMNGKILQTPEGRAGGGFILYNVPADLHEVVVVGSQTQKVYSRVLPVDDNSLSVLSIRE